MASHTDPQVVAMIIENFSSLWDDNCSVLASCILFFYETIITLDREIESFWSKGFSSGAVLFFLNKYMRLVYFAGSVLPLSDTTGLFTDKSCLAFQRAIFVVGIAGYLPWAAFSAMRAHALSRRWAVSGVVLLLSLVPVGLNMITFTYPTVGAVLPTITYCAFSISADPSVQNTLTKLTIASRGSLILADVILIGITWKNLFKRNILSRSLFHYSRVHTFGDILFRDGTIYFITLLGLNAMHIIATMLSIAIDGGAVSEIVNFTDVLTTILVSRFLLNLQEASQQAMKLPSDHPLHFSTNSSFVGVVGATIVPEVFSAEGLSDAVGEECDHTRQTISYDEAC